MAFSPVFVIEEDDQPPDHGEKDPASGLLQEESDTAERAIGTVGCCGAIVMVGMCLMCCGCCRDEFRETYNRHTLFGRWCPISKK